MYYSIIFTDIKKLQLVFFKVYVISNKNFVNTFIDKFLKKKLLSLKHC